MNEEQCGRRYDSILAAAIYFRGTTKEIPMFPCFPFPGFKSHIVFTKNINTNLVVEISCCLTSIMIAYFGKYFR